MEEKDWVGDKDRTVQTQIERRNNEREKMMKEKKEKKESHYL